MVASEGSAWISGDFGVGILRVETSEIVEVEIYCCKEFFSFKEEGFGSGFYYYQI